VFLLGYAADAPAAQTLMQEASSVTAAERERATQMRWDSLLGAAQV